MTGILFTGILILTQSINSNKYYSNLNSMYLSISGLSFIIYDILDKYRPISYVLYHNICYLKIDRTWEVSLFSCYLNSIISTLLRI